ncbi:DUF1593 domain-containing protein [Spirosoma sp. BT702]|uniref:DUF1593 domain-containing protein n=1 Tax=Spirosoma profusum TaxID=2771354 RepID=A0A926XU83_9BACT|nr:DUF1593 domain-containing protein [Spirosoma profusum]MBD2700478.1 DUF1593 domain-containing protein [Spirosoma profusum]
MFYGVLNLFSISLICAGLFLVFGFDVASFDTLAPRQQKPRVLILTDISSLKARHLEPDDGQSMVRLMLYTNSLDVEGLIASSNLGHGQRVQPELVHEVIDAYARVQPNLIQHDPTYPTAARLHALVKDGQPKASPKLPVTTSVGEELDTEASNWIIHVVDQPDSRPVWVCIWGGSADLAQALWKIQQTRSKEAVRTFVRKLRVRAISDQDSTGGWIRQQFPELFFIHSRYVYRGTYRGGNTKLNDSLWVATQVHNPANPLGMLYPNYQGGDIWTRQLGPVKEVKEGDTPSYLSLIPNGLNVAEQPELGGWGGLFTKTRASLYLDKIDSTAAYVTDQTPYMASVYRWRDAWQDDFLARLDWCIKPYNQANHYPNVVVNGDNSGQLIEQVVHPGKTVRFDARQSTDPDRQALHFQWQIYPSSTRNSVQLQGTDTSQLTVQIHSKAARQTIPLLLTVTDSGQPALRQYRRILLRIK